MSEVPRGACRPAATYSRFRGLIRCLTKHEDRKDKAKKIAAGVGGGALAVGGVILTYGKKAHDVEKK